MELPALLVRSKPIVSTLRISDVSREMLAEYYVVGVESKLRPC